MTSLSHEIKGWLESGSHFLVVSHVNPDGDATGSLLAMAQILDGLGKKTTLLNEGATPAKFSFLPDYNRILNGGNATPEQTFDRVIMVDCADRQRVGNVEHWIAADAEILNIDHHSTNDRYGRFALVNPEASATCEVIYDWVREVGLPVTEKLAQCLYTGYLTDTGGFRYSNTTPKVLRDASELVEAGAHPHKIAERSLETITYSHIQLLVRSLSMLELDQQGKAAYLALPLSVFEETGACKEDSEGLVNYARNIEGVEVAVLLRETEDGVKVSFRSKDYVDVSQIAKFFGGGGHLRAAGCFLPTGLEEAKKLIQPVIEKHL